MTALLSIIANLCNIVDLLLNVLVYIKTLKKEK